MPSNFRTYEAQSRLLAAVLASNPGLKLNFKAIAQHYGSDTTTAGIEHRFRPIKKQAGIIRKAVADNKDPKELVNIFHMSDKDIHAYYGDSTPMGIEFQFRAVKKEAKAMRDGTDKGTSPLPSRKATPGSSAATPARKRKTPVTPAGTASASGSGSAPTSGGSIAPPPPAAKRAKRAVEIILSNDEDGCSTLASEEVDYEQLDLTPVSTPSHPMTTNGSSLPPMPSNLAPITPSTSGAATTSYATDTTPALSTGVSPPDQSSPDQADLVFHTAVQHQRQPTFFPHSQSQINNNSITTEDDVPGGRVDDDDDDIFIIDTPSKMPKMEPSVAPSATATLNHIADFGGWDRSQTQAQAFSQPASQNYAQSMSQGLSFDTSGSPSWSLDYPFAGTNDHLASVSFGEPGSFYDNDGAI
ncbi:hypothetical protein Sste5346_005745 [Sporothrix stenoceras]|uniref:Clr5 domain-containing protein n=1 Tax=Sporothrix stenoceras TaxID=5173 RepID=A0ABR3Z5I8_9PEZI